MYNLYYKYDTNVGSEEVLDTCKDTKGQRTRRFCEWHEVYVRRMCQQFPPSAYEKQRVQTAIRLCEMNRKTESKINDWCR